MEKNHLETIRRNYSKSPYIEDVLKIVSSVYEDISIHTLAFQSISYTTYL